MATIIFVENAGGEETRYFYSYGAISVLEYYDEKLGGLIEQAKALVFSQKESAQELAVKQNRHYLALTPGSMAVQFIKFFLNYYNDEPWRVTLQHFKSGLYSEDELKAYADKMMTGPYRVIAVDTMETVLGRGRDAEAA